MKMRHIVYSTTKKQYDAIWQAAADKIDIYASLLYHFSFTHHELHETERRGNLKSGLAAAQVRAGCTLSGC